MKYLKWLFKAAVFTVAGCAMTVAWLLFVVAMLIAAWVFFVWSTS